MNLKYALGLGMLTVALAGCGGQNSDQGSTNTIVHTTTPPPQNTTVVVTPPPTKTTSKTTTTVVAKPGATTSGQPDATDGVTPPVGPPKKGAKVPGDQTTTTSGDQTSGTSSARSAKGALPGWPTTASTQKTSDGLQYKDLKVGTGPSPKSGDNVTVTYTGYLTDGTKFDSSFDHGGTFDFVIGQGNVIKGWDEGVASMKVGGKRKLIVPPDLGYGPGGSGPIPPNSTLIFDVELIKTGAQ
ncbi:MAG: FKBP-type peptidyl-prolyl cis-trans isomerase [Chloroflexi bacterium]|nr:FKBP-type peptidyl-prolyl cis-trans isomerase [Chloroflexota bacterium]